MRNILALVGAATLAFLIVGWYLGWYQISAVPSPNGENTINLKINPDKTVSDIRKGGQIAADKAGQVVDKLQQNSTGDQKPGSLPTPGAKGDAGKSNSSKDDSAYWFGIPK